MRRLKEIIENPEGRFSSKRLCGVLGWIVILFSYLYILITNQVEPEFTESLLWAIVTLLGVESITYAFKKGNKAGTLQNKKENENNGSEVR